MLAVPDMDPPRTAAFFRVEGSLVSRGVISAAAYFAAGAAGFGERAVRLGQVALTAPLYSVLGQSDRTLANRIAYLALRGMSEDRIVVLAEEYFAGVLRERVLEGGVDLLRAARRAGHRVVLISDTLDQVMQPLLTQLRWVDDHICNHLELRDGFATGKLQSPVVGGHDSARWVRRYAADHDIDLARSVVYAAHGPDLLLMSSVGQACAVNPDFTLRRAAREADWPVMDYDA
jgi:phosphoserine phosphatase